MARGRLTEHKTSFGYDCVFLDRESNPGVAGCRLWPRKIAPSNVGLGHSGRRIWNHPRHGEEAKANTPCPGMGRGTLVPVESIRIVRPVEQAQGMVGQDFLGVVGR